MPVKSKDDPIPLYQRDQYEKGGVGRLYWNYRDKAVLSFLDIRDRMIADVGCGEGITLERALRLFSDRDFLGVDRLLENLSICAGRGLPVVGGDVYSLPFMSEYFSCVLLVEVIEHLSEPEKALIEIRRILRPEGKLIVVFPNDKNFKFARLLTCKFREAFYDPGHLRQWTPKDIKSFLFNNGFRTLLQTSIPFRLWYLSLHHIVVCEKTA